MVEPTVERIVKGGEVYGLELMERKMADEGWVRGFEKPKTSYTSVEGPDTTCLSAYFSMGSLSVRTFWHTLEGIQKRGSHTQPPVSL